MCDGDIDHILSQALDMAEERESREENIFITQSSFREVSNDDEDQVSLSQLFAIDNAIDVSDMLDIGGPSLVQATRMQDESKRFNEVSREQVEAKTKPFVPENTLRKNKWAVNLFKNWKCEFLQYLLPSHEISKQNIGELLRSKSDLTQYNNEELDQLLRYFFIALKKENGSEYTGDSIFAILCGIQRHLQLNGRDVNFMTDKAFSNLKVVVDNIMQEKCTKGIGIKKKRADPITQEQENVLWQKGLLGTHSPSTLLDTIFWIVGVYFGLRGGEEHRKLSMVNFEIKSDNDNANFLEYTESVSKTYRGGIKHRKIEPHTCRAYETKDDRCPVYIFRKYISFLPTNRKPDAFYFQPLVKPKQDVWFSQQCLGHNKLEGIVKRITSAAGFEGNFTNHSLRASTATRLYRAGLSDQIIKEQTGHRSNAVESYRRTSDRQMREVSNILRGEVPSEAVVEPTITRNVSTDIKVAPTCDEKQQVAGVGIASIVNFKNIDNVTINVYHQ